MDIEAVVIWGHPLHSHTHSYIHNAFKRAFDYMRYKWYWLDDNKPFHEYGITLPERCLFITEGNVDKNIILNPKSYYLIHNCSADKYKKVIPENHILNLQVFTTDALNHGPSLNGNKFIRFDGKCLYMPWGTDLMPNEIDDNINKLEQIISNSSNSCEFIGMYLANPWDYCKKVCELNNVKFNSIGGFNNRNISVDDNMKRVQQSLIAPAFQEPWQVEHGYIPCRIFKNISYGKMGITNNQYVQELFNHKLIYNSSVELATQQAIKFSTKDNKELLKELMIEIRDKHTYINRINDIFEAFSKL